MPNVLNHGNHNGHLMKADQYIDGVSQVHFVGGMVRLDMFVLSPQPGAEPLQSDAGRIVMTPQAFLSMFETMQQFVGKLAEAGVLREVPQAQRQ